MTSPEAKRLNKYISDTGYCSRREADKLIEQNKVTINGKVPELGTKVIPGDKVAVNGKLIAAVAADKSDRVYIAYNKPVGITCTTERHVRGNIIDAIRHKQRIFPIGRLDKPSEGLILLTSDGDIVNKILRAENAHDKEYLVTVDQPVSERFLQKMAKGVPILGTVTKPCQVALVSKFQFRIILTQGLNRQIRRMCEFLGYEVTRLMRTRIMHLDLTGLKSGKWRELTPEELSTLNDAVKDSAKTAQLPSGEDKTLSLNTSKGKADHKSNHKSKLNTGKSSESAKHSKPPTGHGADSKVRQDKKHPDQSQGSVWGKLPAKKR